MRYCQACTHTNKCEKCGKRRTLCWVYGLCCDCHWCGKPLCRECRIECDFCLGDGGCGDCSIPVLQCANKACDEANYCAQQCVGEDGAVIECEWCLRGSFEMIVARRRKNKNMRAPSAQGARDLERKRLWTWHLSWMWVSLLGPRRRWIVKVEQRYVMTSIWTKRATPSSLELRSWDLSGNSIVKHGDDKCILPVIWAIERPLSLLFLSKWCTSSWDTPGAKTYAGLKHKLLSSFWCRHPIISPDPFLDNLAQNLVAAATYYCGRLDKRVRALHAGINPDLKAIV